MSKIFSVQETQALEKKAVEELKIPAVELMERAGKGLAELAAEVFPKGPIAIVCGKGNNGGDGLAAARFLAQKGYELEILLVCKPEALKAETKAQYDALLKAGVKVQIIDPEEAPEAGRPVFDISTGIIDAVFGIGLSTKLVSPWRDLIDAINESGKKVISADIPSGLNADTGEVMGSAVKAAATAVFGTLKRGLTEGQGPAKAGEIRFIDIGLPE